MSDKKLVTTAKSHLAWCIAAITHLIEERMGEGYILPQEEIEAMTVSRLDSDEEYCIVEVYSPDKPELIYRARYNKFTDFVYITVHEQIDASGYKLSEVFDE